MNTNKAPPVARRSLFPRDCLRLEAETHGKGDLVTMRVQRTLDVELVVVDVVLAVVGAGIFRLDVAVRVQREFGAGAKVVAGAIVGRAKALVLNVGVDQMRPELRPPLTYSRAGPALKPPRTPA